LVSGILISVIARYCYDASRIVNLIVDRTIEVGL
jgi:hypothetical protein